MYLCGRGKLWRAVGASFLSFNIRRDLVDPKKDILTWLVHQGVKRAHEEEPDTDVPVKNRVHGGATENTARILRKGHRMGDSHCAIRVSSKPIMCSRA